MSNSLCASFQTLIEALPGKPQRPRHVALSIGANQNLAHRLCSAIAKEDPLEALLTMPGIIPLTQFADSAEEHGVPKPACEAARQAVREFDELVRHFGDSRTTFDAVLSDWVPSARAQIDTTARQSVYRGLRQVRGVSSDTYFFSMMMHPSPADTDRHDVLVMTGHTDIERIRASGRLVMSQEVHLIGNAAVGDAAFRVLPEFCTGPTPVFRSARDGSTTRTVLEWDDTFGRASKRNMALSCLHRNGFVRRRKDDNRVFGSITTRPEVPTKRMVVDLFLHRDALPACVPAFRVSLLKWSDINSPNNPADEINVIPQDVDVLAIAEGDLLKLQTPGVPFYARMLAQQCEQAGWRIEDFRGFRVCVDYPLIDADSQFILTLPQADLHSS